MGFGPVAFVRLGRDRTTKRVTGTAFVEFEAPAGLAAALGADWKERTVVLAGKPLKLKVRKYEKDHKAKVAEARAAAGQKRKAEAEAGGGEGEAGSGEPKVYDFELPENFEAELKALIPRHVKFTGVKAGTLYYELREFFAQFGEVKYVTHDAIGGVALVKFLRPETAAKFFGDAPEIKEVVFKEAPLTVTRPTEDEVRDQLKAKNARKRLNLEGRTHARGGRGGGRGGGGRGGGGRGRGRGGGRGAKRARHD